MEPTKAAINAAMDATAAPGLTHLSHEEYVQVVAREVLAAMLEPAAWQGIDTESGYKRSYEVEADFRHMKNKPWFRAKRTYTIKEPK